MEDISTANLVTVALAITIAAWIPAAYPRLPLPGVVLEVLLGVIAGPQVFGLVHPGVAQTFLADLGLAMLFLMAGFEMNPAVLRGAPLRNALNGWALTAAIAVAAAIWLTNHGLATSWMLTGLAVSTTGVGALLPILRDDSLLSPPYGPMVLAAGAIGEAAPVIVLTLVLAQGRAPEQALIMLLFAAGAFRAVVLAGRARSGSFARIVERTMDTSGQFPMRLAIFMLILFVVLSEQLGIDLILGAFTAGAVVRAAVPRRHHEAMDARLDGIGSAFLVPIFFVISGTRLDAAALFSSAAALSMTVVYALLMLVTRGVPALLLYRADLTIRRRAALALHCGTQLPLVVAIAGIAVHRGLMPSGQGAALVGGGILSMILFPALARQLLQAAPIAAAPPLVQPAEPARP